MTEQIEAILFDFGGTLRRTTERDYSEKIDLIKKILELIGHPAEPVHFLQLLSDRGNAYHDWAERESTELNEVDLWTRWMLPDFPPQQIRPLAVKLNQTWRDSSGKREMMPETRETILTLFRRGYRLGLVSNTTSSIEVPLALDELGISGCFDTVILSCQVGLRKPDAAILLEAARRMTIHPGRCAYIGNKPERDVAAGRNAGFKSTVLLRNPQQPLDFSPPKEQLPDHYIDNLKELLELFPSRLGGKEFSANNRVYDASLSSMWGIKKFSAFADFLLAAKRFGFSGVELNHQVNPSMLAEVDLRCCRFTSIHEPCPAVISAVNLKKQDLLISSPNEQRRLEGVISIKRSIDLANHLGCGTVVVHCGQIQAEWTLEQDMVSLFEKGQSDSLEYQELRKRFEDQRATLVAPYLDSVRKSLRELLDYARPLGVRLGIENRYHYSDIPSQDEMEEILAMAGPDQLGFIYDVGHAQTQDRLGFYPHEQWLKRYSSRMIGTHIHDVIGIHDHHAPGLGEVDFQMVATYLPRDAFRTIEVISSNTPEQITAGMKILVETGCVTLK